MSNYNHVTLVGNLVKDPEIKVVNKRSKANFVIAVERNFGKDKPEVVDYFTIVSWGKLAEVCGTYLKKGKKVLVDGRIQIRAYESENQKKWVTEVVAENCKFLSLKQDDKKVENSIKSP